MAAETHAVSEILQLTQRVADLEVQVADLQRVTSTLVPPGIGASQISSLPFPERPVSLSLAPPSLPPAPPRAPDPAVSATPRKSFDLVHGSQYWLNKIGIGLLLLGVAFLFKYTVDQGWITPAIRVLFGALLGGGLIGLGIAVRKQQRHFGQVIQGGGIGTLYLTTFAAFYLYDLLPYPVAFMLMVSVTVLALGLAVWQNAQVLALIAAIGGLATPFLLDTGAGSVAGLLAGTSAIYLFRPWRSLLLTTFVGGWLIFFISALSLSFSFNSVTFDHWSLLLGVIFAWLIFWAFPILCVEIRPLLPASTSSPLHHNDWSLHGLTLLTPLIALGVARMIWHLPDATWGVIVGAGAGVYALAAWGIHHRVHTRDLAATHVLAALALLTISFVLLLNGDALFLAVAIEALLIQYVAARHKSWSMAAISHGIFVWLAVWIVIRLIGTRSDPALINGQALTELAGLGLGLATLRVLGHRQTALCYGIVLYALLLGWLGRESGQLFDGTGFVSVAWGVYGITLLVVGLRRDTHWLVVLGLGTIALVVAKLFLIDLSELKAVWRIMLFMGFGGVFLTLSYFFQALWRPAANHQH